MFLSSKCVETFDLSIYKEGLTFLWLLQFDACHYNEQVVAFK